MNLVRTNRAFWRALHGLSSNVCLAAICALVANDHFFRIRFPSWITGKLGDFAWLVFAPFICALALAWLVGGQRQESVAGVASFGFIGLWFVLAKTTPLVNGWTVDALAWLLGYRGILRIDPTDLLTLPGLWLGWRVWRRSDNRPETLKARAWVFVSAGVVATVATSTIWPPHGIGRFCREGPALVALTFPLAAARGYISRDDGRTWTALDVVDDAILDGCGRSRKRTPDGQSHVTFSPSPYQTTGIVEVAGLQYRVSQGDTVAVPGSAEPWGSGTEYPSAALKIERSSDGGRTWSLEFDISILDSLEREFRGEPTDPGPNDAVVTPEGTLVLAMGTDGILARKKDGVWTWAAAGPYEHRTLGAASRIRLVSWSPMRGYPPVVLTLTLVALAVLTIGNTRNPPELWRRGFAVLLWFLLLLALGPPVLDALAGFALMLLFPIEAFMAASAAGRIYRLDRKAFGMVAVLSLVAGVLSVLPPLLWTFNTVPNYTLAQFYGLCLGAAAVVSGRIAVRRGFPRIFNLPLGMEGNPD